MLLRGIRKACATSENLTKSTFPVDKFSVEFPGGNAMDHRSKAAQSVGYQKIFVSTWGKSEILPPNREMQSDKRD
ncbi:hypothetical protein NPIL_313671 [Nephila pilipes]|uniref:Uncharacterized protein n=1 Tax=Nephila pilipes TaxID=299642 RepID=A0A8X6P959_NEPPI|nr:hypothetical protein NPIL_313671 [Nephila pilipes]